MNLKYYYYYFHSVMSDKLCDDIIKYCSHSLETAKIGGKNEESDEPDKWWVEGKEVEKKSGMNGAVVKMSSFSQFKRIVEAGDRTFMTAKVFVDETPTGFDFCFSDSVATYECFVSKDLIKDEKNFRFSYVEHSFKGKLIQDKEDIIIIASVSPDYRCKIKGELMKNDKQV